ncbi:MAG: SUMF1/EgtB/PvdO family nonheme iron enzyme, partial [Bacteroidota bacterium]
KYELSQQEYCDFLNCLRPTQQSQRDIREVIEYQRPIRDYRNFIHKKQGIFVSDRPDHPCNFISWSDGLAYSDWAGLRPMTELEFEKACRGSQAAIYREYVWGVNEINNKENMVFCNRILNMKGDLAQSEAGVIKTEGNIHASMFSYFNIDDVCVPGAPFYDPDCDGCRSFVGGDGGRGPVKRGIFGLHSGGSRIQSGAAYYGAMEMGGNLQEPVVSVGHPNGRKFQGTHGDGELNERGESNNQDWLPRAGSGYAFGGRGGCWKFHENHARTADRFKGLRRDEKRRASHIGYRGVRTQIK